MLGAFFSLLVVMAPPAQADSFLTSVEFVCTPSVRGDTCGEGPLEKTLETSRNAIEHAAVIRTFNGYKYNSALLTRLNRFRGYSESLYRNFDYAFAELYSTSWGGRKGQPDRAVRTLVNELANLPYDAPAHLIAALGMAQYEAFVLNKPWDEQTREKAQVKALLQKAVALGRQTYTPGLDETLRSAIDYINLYPGYAGI